MVNFWIGFASGFVSLFLLCILYAAIFPKIVKRGAQKFDDARTAFEEKEKMKKIWLQFYNSKEPIK